MRSFSFSIFPVASGTRKVISEHSTLGLVVTTDGSFGEIPRNNFLDAEAKTVAELKKQGYKDVFLWVLEENLGARHFYEKEGFSATDDDLNDNIGGKDLREIRYIYGG